MSWRHAVVLLCTAAVLLYAATDLPAWGDAGAPPARHLSPRYIEDAYRHTHAPNMVTAVIGDYRSSDTLYELAVIFTAGLACALILAERRREDER